MSSPRYEPKLDRSCFLIASTLNEDMICATKEILLLAVLEGLLWMTHRRVDGRVLQAPRLLACGHINDQCDNHALHHAYSDFQIRKRDANFANCERSEHIAMGLSRGFQLGQTYTNFAIRRRYTFCKNLSEWEITRVL